MNAGLSSLSVLKGWLLAPALRDSTDYDDQIAALGLGVARQMERFCARQFERVVGATYETRADRLTVVVDRFPVETVTKIEVRDDVATDWVEQGSVSDVLYNAAYEHGILEFAGMLGSRTSRIRITYTGGFWFDTSEDASASLPSEATALPDDLRLAWLTQCEFHWSQRDKLGVNIAQKPASDAPIAHLDLLPAVKQTLQAYVRFSTS